MPDLVFDMMRGLTETNWFDIARERRGRMLPPHLLRKSGRTQKKHFEQGWTYYSNLEEEAKGGYLGNYNLLGQAEMFSDWQLPAERAEAPPLPGWPEPREALDIQLPRVLWSVKNMTGKPQGEDPDTILLLCDN